jgi:hypothetical protein
MRKHKFMRAKVIELKPEEPEEDAATLLAVPTDYLKRADYISDRIFARTGSFVHNGVLLETAIEIGLKALEDNEERHEQRNAPKKAKRKTVKKR